MFVDRIGKCLHIKKGLKKKIAIHNRRNYETS